MRHGPEHCGGGGCLPQPPWASWGKRQLGTACRSGDTRPGLGARLPEDKEPSPSCGLWPPSTPPPEWPMAPHLGSGVSCPGRSVQSGRQVQPKEPQLRGCFQSRGQCQMGAPGPAPVGRGHQVGGGCKEPRALPRQPPLPAPSRARPLPRGPTSQPGNSESTALRPDARLQPHGGLLCAGRSGNVGQRLLTWPWARATGRRITGTARGRRGPRPQQLSRLHTDPHPQTGAACRGAPTTQHLHLCWGPAPGAPSSKQLCCWEMPPVWCLLQPLQTTGHRAGGRH